ncbi:MAG: histidine kinase [Salibacteraceae bacterium]
MGKVYNQQGHYAKSIQYLEKALEKSDSLEHRMARIYRYLGLNHRASGQLQKAIAYFELCLPMEKSLKNQISIEEFLVDCHSQLSNYLKAFEYQRQVTQHQDSLHAREQEKRITEVVEKYENEQKTMKIEKLNTENRHKGEVISQQKLNFGIALALLLLLGAGGFLWIRFRQKLQEGINQLEKNQLQQRFLRVQLNPHFLFHALSSIESYIYTNEKESAAAFLRNFSKLMRNILETSDQDFVSLENDLDTMREYLMMQQLNSDFKFEYDITVDENLNLQTLQVPPMLIQPFIENAILHGALQVKNGTVAIHYLSTARHLQIRIKDNGPGLTSGEHRSGSLWRSMGMEIVQQRIQNLEKSHGLHIQYRIAANEGQKGTIVVLDVPIRQVSAA